MPRQAMSEKPSRSEREQVEAASRQATEYARRNASSLAVARRRTEAGDDPFADLFDDLDDAKIIPDRPAAPIIPPLSLAQEDVEDRVLTPLIKQRAKLASAARKAAREFKRAKEMYDLRAPGTRTADHDHLIKTRLAESVAAQALADHDAHLSRRRVEIAPTVSDAIAGVGGWRIKDGRPLDAKGRWLQAYFTIYEQLRS